MTTYAGKLLRIDLTNSTWHEEEVSVASYRHYISARGLAAKYLYDELRPHIDPLGPDNRLVFSIGVLAGTGLQGFSKWCVTSKSPLTNTIFRSISGGNFGMWMKYAGYDLLIIQGKAPVLSYVYLDTKRVLFCTADELLGLDPGTVQKKMKERHGSRTESTCIGFAGEKLVRYATISAGERTAARGGMGTVMGSKNLKAIAINVPVHQPSPFDESTFEELVKGQIHVLKSHPRRENMNTFGTPYITTVVNALGVLPVKNFQEGTIPQLEDISGDVFYELKRAKAGCYHCMTRCGGMREVVAGPLKGSVIDGPEYESIYAFGPLLGVTDRQFIIDANAACDYYGLDTISTGVSIAFASELFEKGILTGADTDGLDLSWGNKESVFSLIERIGKRKGVGRLLGEGVRIAAEEIGRDASSYAMHIKGLELSGYDPRGIKGYALSMATSNIGGSHMYGRPRAELAGKIDPFTEKGKGDPIAQVQKEQAVEDSLIACTFGNSGLNLTKYAQLLTAATGMEEFTEENDLLRIGERIVCVERCFNMREGFWRKDDSLPRRMTSEPLREAGPSTGQVVRDLDTLLDEYYEALGYTREGVPTAEKLKDLGIETETLSATKKPS
jgi:aldehyde:ferredoxin oxidoreductase